MLKVSKEMITTDYVRWLYIQLYIFIYVYDQANSITA